MFSYGSLVLLRRSLLINNSKKFTLITNLTQRLRLHTLNNFQKSNKITLHKKPVGFFYKNQNAKIHLSSRKNAIPPIVFLLMKPLSKVAAVILGRGFRSWWAALRPHLSTSVITAHVGRHKGKYITSSGTIVIGGNIFYYTHLQTAPITNRKRFILFTPSQMLDIEKLSMEALVEEHKEKIVTTQTYDVYRVLKIINRLIEANKDIEEINNMNWHLTLIDDATVNACVYPSGHVVVYTGILSAVKNDDELASILGHEISHAVLQHQGENLTYSTLLHVISVCVILTIWTIFPSDLTASFMHWVSNRIFEYAFELPFSRCLEKEADYAGIQIAAKACYDVRCFPDFWHRQAKNENLPCEYLSTHPASEKRALYMEQIMPEILKIRNNCKCAPLPDRVGSEAHVLKK